MNCVHHYSLLFYLHLMTNLHIFSFIALKLSARWCKGHSVHRNLNEENQEELANPRWSWKWLLKHQCCTGGGDGHNFHIDSSLWQIGLQLQVTYGC